MGASLLHLFPKRERVEGFHDGSFHARATGVVVP